MKQKSNDIFNVKFNFGGKRIEGAKSDVTTIELDYNWWGCIISSEWLVIKLFEQQQFLGVAWQLNGKPILKQGSLIVSIEENS